MISNKIANKIRGIHPASNEDSVFHPVNEWKTNKNKSWNNDFNLQSTAMVFVMPNIYLEYVWIYSALCFCLLRVYSFCVLINIYLVFSFNGEKAMCKRDLSFSLVCS